MSDIGSIPGYGAVHESSVELGSGVGPGKYPGSMGGDWIRAQVGN